jgi:hypothetical protein
MSSLLIDPFILTPVALLFAAPAISIFQKPEALACPTPAQAAPDRERSRILLSGPIAPSPALHVFPQVAFAAFLTDDGQLSKNVQWAIRAKFDCKRSRILSWAYRH